MPYRIFLAATFLVFLFMQATLSSAFVPEEQLLSSAEQARILSEFSARLKTIKRFQAEFVQDRHIQTFLDVLQTKGIIQFEAPDKLRWEVRQPYSSISILNGKKAAKFDIENGKVTRMTGMEDFLYEVLHQIAVIIQGNFEGIGKSFQIKAGRIDQRYILHLQPKDRNLSKSISGMQILSDVHLERVQQVTIFEQQGDRIEITFSQPSEGLTFGPRVFDLRQPISSE